MKLRTKRPIFAGVALAIIVTFSALPPAWAGNEIYSGQFSPSDYTSASLLQAQEDLEDLQRALRNRNLAPTEFAERIRVIAARNKRGLKVPGDDHASDHVIDVRGLDIPGLSN